MTGIPQKYAFLSAVGLLPRAITYGLATLGTNELIGKGSNPVIMSWRDELKRAGIEDVDGYSDDSVPWCGLWQAIITLRAGKRPIDQPLWAMNWGGYGVEIARNVGTVAKPQLRFVTGLKACLGDVLAFQRAVKDAAGKTTYSGHTGRYIAEDDLYYHVLGGNQGDTVSITRVAKSRCIAVRRDVMTIPPASLRPFHVAANGAVSINEA